VWREENKSAMFLVFVDQKLVLGMRMWDRRIAAFLIVIVYVSLLPTELLFPGSFVVEQDFVKYRLREPKVCSLTYTVQILSGGIFGDESTELYVPLIQNVTNRHLVIVSGISPFTKVLKDEYGNLYCYWTGGGALTVSITYDILSYSIDFLVSPNLIGAYNKSSVMYQDYIQPEECIESNDPLIISIAKKIVGTETNPHKMAYKIFKFVIKTLRYEAIPEDKGALWALKNGKGKCAEYACLFVALCRAVGIPSRVRYGLVLDYGERTTKAEHAWAEYYLENYGWVPTDPSWKLFDKMDNHHFAFVKNRTASHLRVHGVCHYPPFDFGSPEVRTTTLATEASIGALESYT
jgi:hypothetical protein